VLKPPTKPPTVFPRLEAAVLGDAAAWVPDKVNGVVLFADLALLLAWVWFSMLHAFMPELMPLMLIKNPFEGGPSQEVIGRCS
jgi:hypothetical protein